MLFLGDTHGDFNILNIALGETDGPVIQVGDFGLGFPDYVNVATGQKFKRDPDRIDERIRFMRGNHDNPEKCRSYPNYLGEYGYNEELGIFFVGGAWSIDRATRTEGVDWWADEELSYPELLDAIVLYEKIKPDVVVSHTCPSCVINLFMDPPRIRGHRTENALDSMFQFHRPKRWIFGHWHRRWKLNVLGTEFKCLDINERSK